jgi:predicted nucleotidyltransferase
MNERTQIELSKDKIASFCKKHHIRKLSLFGSVLRDDFGPTSDVDVLVEFEPGHVPSFFRLFDMEDELSVLFGGRKVNLRTPEDLSRHFRQSVLAMAVVQYAAWWHHPYPSRPGGRPQGIAFCWEQKEGWFG